MEKEIFKLLLPEGLLEHFKLVEVKELCRLTDKKLFYELHLEENNVLHSGYESSLYESKDFTEIRVQDFPLRGKDVFLVIRRRRWRNKTNPKEIVRNDYTYIAEGSKLTKELADFLKGTGRYTGRYD
ncbi:MAG: transposase family protein [Bacteroidetes bacterium]|nr:transposase family protein [Bacteroidota bacterium]